MEEQQTIGVNMGALRQGKPDRHRKGGPKPMSLKRVFLFNIFKPSSSAASDIKDEDGPKATPCFDLSIPSTFQPRLHRSRIGRQILAVGDSCGALPPASR